MSKWLRVFLFIWLVLLTANLTLFNRLNLVTQPALFIILRAVVILIIGVLTLVRLFKDKLDFLNFFGMITMMLNGVVSQVVYILMFGPVLSLEKELFYPKEIVQTLWYSVAIAYYFLYISKFYL